MIHTVEESSLDLELIGANCRSLEWLHLLYIDSCQGTLQGLSSLEELHADSCFHDFQPGSLIPVHSMASLTHLALLFGYEEFWLDDAFEARILDRFVNLKSLYVHPFSNELCDFLLRITTIELNEFRTTVLSDHGLVDRLKIVAMFSKPSLRSLRSLCFAVEDHD